MVAVIVEAGRGLQRSREVEQCGLDHVITGICGCVCLCRSPVLGFLQQQTTVSEITHRKEID